MADVGLLNNDVILDYGEIDQFLQSYQFLWMSSVFEVIDQARNTN